MGGCKISPAAIAGAGFITLTIASAVQAASVAIGAPGDDVNCFPFGCGGQEGSPGTRYQQVYNQDLFPDYLEINFVSFFNAIDIDQPESINPATYSIYLSSTTKPVNGLDTTDFDRNVGPDNSLFFKGFLSGPIGPTKIFSIAGNQFDYTPSKGNLLLDVYKSPGGSDPLDTVASVYLDARFETFGNQSSRAHNFGEGFDEKGLVTEFGSEKPTSVPIPEPSSVLGAVAFCAFLGAKFVVRHKN